ncbi:MAG: HD domain-containing protein [Tumebacillaceae bacterium]
MEPLVWDVIEQLHSKYGGRVAHAKHVAALCYRLFVELAPLHDLGEMERTPLLCAAHLHDIGHFVNKKQHHKHSYHLIMHDRLLDGWDAKLRENAALIALNHRKKKLLMLDDLKKASVKKMRSCIAIVRLADALDCEHDQQTQIERVEYDRTARLVKITLRGYPVQKHRKCLQAKASLAVEAWDVALYIENETGTEHLCLTP